MIIGSKDVNDLNEFKSSLSERFKMKDLGVIKYFLGIEFLHDKVNNSITMGQHMYVERILQRFGLADCSSKGIPCTPGINKELCDKSKVFDNTRLYREMVGSLIYVMMGTRPDLCYAVTLLSQHMAKPTLAHLNLCKQVYRYLKGTISYNMTYCKTKDDLNLTGFSDSDWGASPDGKSTSGYCFSLDNRGPLIAWRSCKQRVVALSSCEAEYIALTDAMKEGNFLRQLLADMTGSELKVVKLYADNQGAIALSKNPVHRKRSRHINIRYHFIRQNVDEGIVKLEYIPTAKNIADMFTKPLPKSKLTEFACIRGAKV